jgi:hypothetical protein
MLSNAMSMYLSIGDLYFLEAIAAKSSVSSLVSEYCDSIIILKYVNNNLWIMGSPHATHVMLDIILVGGCTGIRIDH